jgi:hypothetical protein
MILSKRMADHKPHDMICELVDNALDANAQRVWIELGRRGITVADDGHGMVDINDAIRFGKGTRAPARGGVLGRYGVGMTDALCKLGPRAEVTTSSTPTTTTASISRPSRTRASSRGRVVPQRRPGGGSYQRVPRSCLLSLLFRLRWARMSMVSPQPLELPPRLWDSDPERHEPAEPPEDRLRQLAAGVGPLRRALAAIAERLIATRAHEQLCFARISDYARERPGVSARQLQELARVHRAFAELPELERALVTNELPWSKVRLIARVAL